MTCNWINIKTHLEGESVNLIPLEKKHFPELINIASDKKIWEFYISDYSDEGKITEELEKALIEKEKGTQFPFVIKYKLRDKIIGSTRFLDINAEHRKLEIGWTWMKPDYWATEINPECKLLLLTFCFEKLNTLRVQFKTDERNLRSSKAIEKIGGMFEGILRNDMIRENGTMRNSALYSIISGEWNKLKPKLTESFLKKKDSSLLSKI
jgi:RimJ/RimL family protein N-acetyltransferase